MTGQVARAGVEGVLGHRRVLSLAVPAVLEMVLHLAAWAVDTAMVGRLGASALSAVGLGGQIYFTTAFILACVAVGTGALVARESGAGRDDAAARAAGQGLLLSLALGMALALAARASAGRLFALVGMGPEVARDGTAYLTTLAPAAAFFIPSMMSSSIMRARGDTRTPLYITGVTNIVNIAGDWALIYGNLGFEAQGVAGAARALLLAQAAGLVLSLVALGRIRGLPLGRRCWSRPHRDTIARIVRIGLPAGVETMLIDGARVTSMLIIASLGPVALAATQVGVTAEALSFMPGHGFAIAAGILAGRGAGAGRPDQVRRSTVLCRSWAMGLMGVVGLAFVLAPSAFIRVFTDDPEIIRLGASCLRVGGLAQPLCAVAETTLGSLRGMGDTRRAVAITALGSWGLRVPLTLLLIKGAGLGVVVAWWAMLADWVLRSILVTHYFQRGSWQSLKV